LTFSPSNVIVLGRMHQIVFPSLVVGDTADISPLGSLEYNSTERARQLAIYSAVPTVVDMYLGRPAAIPEVAENAAALLGSFGSGPDAFLDVIFGDAEPRGKLPFDLPRSNAAVEASDEDVPFDTENPVFKFGDGLAYGESCA
jgi:hypothetical protein